MKSEFYLSLIENLRNDSVKDLDSHFLRIKKMIAISIFLLSIFVSSSDNENIEVFSSEPDPTIILVDFQNEGYWAPYRITDRSKWQATANSEETKDTTKVEGPIQHIYDGTREKYWHTRWGSGSGNHDDRPGGTGPYHFIIDLGEETTFRAFSYTPRVKGSDGWQNGNILHYEFYIAESKEEIENKISSDNYLYKGDFQYTLQQTSTDQTSLVVFSLPKTSRFIALRSIDHGGHASCSEFNLYTDPLPTPLPTATPTPKPTPVIIMVDFQNEGYWAPYRITDRSKWQATANSEETKDTTKVEGPIQHIYDGTREKYWHTRWGSGSGNHDDRPGGTGPYHFIIDLGEETTFRAFSYTPRVKGSDGWQNGNILHYEFYIAESKEEIENKISSDNYLYKGDFQYTHQQTSTDQTSLVVFSVPETSRFIALRSIDHGGHASCSEFNLYTDPLPTPLPTPSPKPTPVIIMVDFQNEGYWAPYRITDRSKWQATANSEETKDTTKVEGPIQHIYDGTREKYWHTRWGSGSGNHDDRPGGTGPYHFIIDLGEETTFRAFSYTPRVKGSDGWQNGNILHYEFYIAESKEEIENKISSDNYLYKGDFQYTHQQTSTDQTSLVVFSVPETSRFIALRSIDHGGHASCSEFNLYTDPPASPEPTQSPSPHPSVTPEASQTPLPTEPEKVPDPTIIKEENRDENRRVDRIINQTESVMLKIEVTLFEKINHPDDGGAIHVINAGIQCNGNHFDQCTSTKAGGAIYVNNDYDFLTLLSFEHLEIKNCVAQCGGGIFIRTTSNKNAVNIKSCQFESNTASATENDNVELYGGSAIYLNAPRGVIIRNRFNGNTGEGGSIKLCNSFEEVSKSSLLLSKLNEVLIKDCLFEISKKEKCSIFYDRGSKGSLFKIDQCTFTGKLSPGSNYICGRVISNDSQMLLVKKCKFGYNLKDLEELKMNSMHFMKMDVSEQVTIDGEKKKGSFALSKVAIVLAAVAAVAALAVCLFIFFTKKSEKEESSQSEESEIDQEIFNSLI